MSRLYQKKSGDTGGPALGVGTALTYAALATLLVSILVLTTAWGTESRLGAPLYWPWVLTGLQVLALWAAGTRRWWGWLLGASVQLPWIAYAVVTGQIGFIPGCAISAVVQTYSFLRADTLSTVRDARIRRVESYA